MGKKIVILGTVDTKGETIAFSEGANRSRGLDPILMDLSMGGHPGFQADITPQEIARLVGKTLEELTASKDRFVRHQSDDRRCAAKSAGPAFPREPPWHCCFRRGDHGPHRITGDA